MTNANDVSVTSASTQNRGSSAPSKQQQEQELQQQDQPRRFSFYNAQDFVVQPPPTLSKTQSGTVEPATLINSTHEGSSRNRFHFYNNSLSPGGNAPPSPRGMTPSSPRDATSGIGLVSHSPLSRQQQPRSTRSRQGKNGEDINSSTILTTRLSSPPVQKKSANTASTDTLDSVEVLRKRNGGDPEITISPPVATTPMRVNHYNLDNNITAVSPARAVSVTRNPPNVDDGAFDEVATTSEIPSSNPYEDAIKEALELLRKHRSYSSLSSPQQQPPQHYQPNPRTPQRRFLQPPPYPQPNTPSSSVSSQLTQQQLLFQQQQQQHSSVVAAALAGRPAPNDWDPTVRDMDHYIKTPPGQDRVLRQRDWEVDEFDILMEDGTTVMTASSPGGATATTSSSNNSVMALMHALTTTTANHNNNSITPKSDTGSTSQASEAYQAEIEARRKQRQERMARYATRLAELKQETGSNTGSVDGAGLGGGNHLTYTDDNVLERRLLASPASPSAVAANWAWDQVNRSNIAPSRPSMNEETKPGSGTASLTAMQHHPTNMFATAASASVSSKQEEVQRGVERVLVAILERASSRSRSARAATTQLGSGSSVASTASGINTNTDASSWQQEEKKSGHPHDDDGDQLDDVDASHGHRGMVVQSSASSGSSYHPDDELLRAMSDLLVSVASSSSINAAVPSGLTIPGLQPCSKSPSSTGLVMTADNDYMNHRSSSDPTSGTMMQLVRSDQSVQSAPAQLQVEAASRTGAPKGLTIDTKPASIDGDRGTSMSVGAVEAVRSDPGPDAHDELDRLVLTVLSQGGSGQLRSPPPDDKVGNLVRITLEKTASAEKRQSSGELDTSQRNEDTDPFAPVSNDDSLEHALEDDVANHPCDSSAMMSTVLAGKGKVDDNEDDDAVDDDDQDILDSHSDSDTDNDNDDESDDDTYTGSESVSHSGVLGPRGGRTGVVLEDDDDEDNDDGGYPSPSILESLSAAAMTLVGAVSSGSTEGSPREEKDRYTSTYSDSADGSTRDSSSDDEDDEENAANADLMRALFAHMLPPQIAHPGKAEALIPQWDEANPDELGYRIVRLTGHQLTAVEQDYENLINLISSERVPTDSDDPRASNDAAFERDLKAAEDLLDREERRFKDIENLASSKPSKVNKEPQGDAAAEEELECLKHFPGIKPAGKGEMGDLEFIYLPVIFKSHVTGFEPTKDLYLEAGNIVAGQYLVEGELGSAAFSTAYKCIDLNSEGDGPEGHEEVCLKVIKNTKDFFDQSLDEIKILELLRQTGKCRENFVLEMKTFFYHREHLVIVTELLRQNLFEFGKYIMESEEEPYFTLPRLSYITRQVLIALKFIHGLGLVHSDVKPENVLISSYSRAEVKLIDFGSSCYLTDRQSSYIQSRSYRAPEVVLGLPYDGRIDVWSLGCVVAEMFTGEVTFQNDSVVSMLSRIEAICGPFPRHMITQGRQSSSYFTRCGLVFEKVPNAGGTDPSGHEDDASRIAHSDDDDDRKRRRRKGSVDVYQSKRTTLTARLGLAPDLLAKRDRIASSLSREEKKQVMFADFLQRLLTIDPEVRPTAQEALLHPWMQYAASLTEADVRYPSK